MAAVPADLEDLFFPVLGYFDRDSVLEQLLTQRFVGRRVFERFDQSGEDHGIVGFFGPFSAPDLEVEVFVSHPLIVAGKLVDVNGGAEFTAALAVVPREQNPDAGIAGGACPHILRGFSIVGVELEHPIINMGLTIGGLQPVDHEQGGRLHVKNSPPMLDVFISLVADGHQVKVRTLVPFEERPGGPLLIGPVDNDGVVLVGRLEAVARVDEPGAAERMHINRGFARRRARRT
jgi:hypothetical protein